ncbi:MAG: hypothetical protein U1D55_06845 [Phycisphaerae bacterium]
MGATQTTPPKPSNERAWLEDRRKTAEAELRAAEAEESRWSMARLLVAVGGALGVYAAWQRPWVVVGVIALAVGVFVFAVARHGIALRRRRAMQRFVDEIDESLRRAGGQVVLLRTHLRPESPETAVLPSAVDEPLATTPTGANLTGAEPTLATATSAWASGDKPANEMPPRRIALTSQEIDDLDFYRPPVGIFGLLNRTYTSIGALRLRDSLEHPYADAGAIERRQESVRWLAGNTETRLNLMAATAGLRHEERFLNRLIAALRGAATDGPSSAIVAIRVWSIASALLCVVFLSRVADPTWLVPLGILLAFNWGIFNAVRRQVRPALERWYDTATAINAYEEVAGTAAARLPDQTELSSLRRHFLGVVDVLPQLRRLTGWAESGGPVHAVLNLMIFYDVHVAASLRRLVAPHRTPLLTGLAAIADLEMLNSLASFAAEQPQYCWPEPNPGGLLEIEDGVHPLLPAARAAPNSLALGDRPRVLVITGSNMSGKTTFLRMAAVNLLLAQIGAPALARRMRWTPARLVTDLQARDNLAGGESYFLAEVRQLRRMVLPPNDGLPIVGIMDEPLRGTNSHEQIAATLAVVEHLAATGHLFLVATHDQQVTGLSDGDSVVNAHFREDLNRDGLVFDYRLRAGPAQSRNALNVLAQEGYPADLVASARRWVARLDEQNPSEAFARQERVANSE